MDRGSTGGSPSRPSRILASGPARFAGRGAAASQDNRRAKRTLHHQQTGRFGVAMVRNRHTICELHRIPLQQRRSDIADRLESAATWQILGGNEHGEGTCKIGESSRCKAGCKSSRCKACKYKIGSYETSRKAGFQTGRCSKAGGHQSGEAGSRQSSRRKAGCQVGKAGGGKACGDQSGRKASGGQSGRKAGCCQSGKAGGQQGCQAGCCQAGSQQGRKAGCCQAGRQGGKAGGKSNQAGRQEGEIAPGALDVWLSASSAIGFSPASAAHLSSKRRRAGNQGPRLPAQSQGAPRGALFLAASSR